MENTYLFLIWNKALWCKDKIINDLSESFKIIKEIEVNWPKEHFEDNIKALYGRKLGPVEDKVLPCGKGSFLLIIVKDNNPVFEKRKMFDGYEIVNSKIYDKKMLYRNWTAGSHRIHCSDTDEENKHDLVVLFGNKYSQVLEENGNYNLDTKGILGFQSRDELLECLQLFGNNKVYIKENELFIFCKCRYDIVEFIKPKEISSNVYYLNINGNKQIINIFGELDGDMPIGSYDIAINYNSIIDAIINSKKEYIDYIKYKNNKTFDNIYDAFGFDTNFKQENPNRIGHYELYKKIISEIKLLIKKITNR